MKKFIFLAGIAVASMTACTKTESVLNTDTQSESVIGFQPVVAKATKASYITNATINAKPSDFKFSVYAWYHEGNGAFTSGATEYMKNVSVTYDKSINDGTDGEGAWKSQDVYYWPKNGKLTFDAYAPTSAANDGTVTSSAAKGIEFNNYTVQSLENQYDLLYSTRTYNKTTSTDGTNTTYDGVDIAFNHALSAIEVKAKTNADGAIKLLKVTVKNVYSKGNFKQNLTDGYDAVGSARAWSDQTSETDYVLYDKTEGSVLSTDFFTGISNAILLPQGFDHENNNKVSIKVDYKIKRGQDWFAQTSSFDLSTPFSGTEEGETKAITAWEIGKRYTYTLVFTLESIYFAPSVSDWTDVTVNSFEVK